jgi:hypothetical protein
MNLYDIYRSVVHFVRGWIRWSMVPGDKLSFCAAKGHHIASSRAPMAPGGRLWLLTPLVGWWLVKFGNLLYPVDWGWSWIIMDDITIHELGLPCSENQPESWNRQFPCKCLLARDVWSENDCGFLIQLVVHVWPLPVLNARRAKVWHHHVPLMFGSISDVEFSGFNSATPLFWMSTW